MCMHYGHCVRGIRCRGKKRVDRADMWWYCVGEQEIGDVQCFAVHVRMCCTIAAAPIHRCSGYNATSLLLSIPESISSVDPPPRDAIINDAAQDYPDLPLPA